ncbi:hypothetical protein EYF80_024844 [Liparis tanakae]|uniref:Uncharacterized protein n=1 Tax=Liparis tanakae TaxID=230148 RepID=A0A4Z2HHF4_9TELE|nr:hypothetical protein EYF80_024844 [Liparis tanakae]
MAALLQVSPGGSDRAIYRPPRRAGRDPASERRSQVTDKTLAPSPERDFRPHNANSTQCV